MDGSGIFVNDVQLVNAADGFLNASKATQKHAEAMDAELKPYAKNPELFQGPPADEFRRLYAEIWDDLDRIKAEATAMSQLVEQAKSGFTQRSISAAEQLPHRSGGGSVLQGLQ